MIPELYITCDEQRFFANTITVKQYKRYTELMQKNSSEKLSDAMFFNLKITQEIFGNRMSLEEIGKADIVEVITAAKGIHIIMQDIISPKFLELMDGEPVQREESAFDEYDLENGYEEEKEQIDLWKTCSDNIDRVVNIAIKLLKNSYSQCLDADIDELLDFIKFELKTINEK